MSTYHALATELADLVERKRRAYGDSTGKVESILRILYPGGIPERSCAQMLLLVRVLDKVVRVATNSWRGHDALAENPWRDIAGYALLALAQETTDES